MLLFVYDYGSFFFILCCLACKIVLSCYIMASKWFSAIHGGLRLFRGRLSAIMGVPILPHFVVKNLRISPFMVDFLQAERSAI